MVVLQKGLQKEASKGSEKGADQNQPKDEKNDQNLSTRPTNTFTFTVLCTFTGENIRKMLEAIYNSLL